MTTDPTTAPAEWIDGHPQLEAIAAAVWDDVLRALDAPLCQTLGYTTPEGLLAAYDTTMRAAVLREAADFAEDVAESLRKHHEFERSTGALDVMTELRRLAAGAQQDAPCGRPGALPGPCSAGDHCCQPQQAGAQQQPTGRDALMRAHTALAAQAGRDQAALERVQQACHDLPYEHARRILDALDGPEQPTTCTATIASEDTPDTPDRCIAPAGHYDEQQQPAFTGPDRNPGGWHTNGQGHMWCDRAATATPHREQPALVSAAETADQIATDLRNAGWHDRALGAEDVAAVLHAGERLNRQSGEQR